MKSLIQLIISGSVHVSEHALLQLILLDYDKGI